MPHRVATFFRTHSSNNPLFDSQIPQIQEPKKALRSSSKNRPSLGERKNSNPSLNSNDSAMPDNSHKRLSFGVSPKSSSRSVPQHHVPAKLDALIESPPLVFYGQPSSSTGALLSGQLRLYITDDNMAIEKFKMKLVVDVCRKKPFHSHCHECSYQSTDLTAWDFLQGPATFRKGKSASCAFRHSQYTNNSTR